MILFYYGERQRRSYVAESSYVHDCFLDFIGVARDLDDGVINSIDSVSFAHFTGGFDRPNYFVFVSGVNVQENIGGTHCLD